MIVASRSRWVFVSFRGRPPRHCTRSPATPSSRKARNQPYTVDGLTPTPSAITVTGSSRAIPSSAVTRLITPTSPALNARLSVCSNSLRVSVVIRMLTVDIVGSWFGLTSSSLPTMSINFPEGFPSPEHFLKVYSLAVPRGGRDRGWPAPQRGHVVPGPALPAPGGPVPPSADPAAPPAPDVGCARPSDDANRRPVRRRLELVRHGGRDAPAQRHPGRAVRHNRPRSVGDLARPVRLGSPDADRSVAVAGCLRRHGRSVPRGRSQRVYRRP